MIFSSITFLFYFLPALLLVYAIMPAKYRNWTLLSSSIFFYAWGAPVFVFVLLASTILDFYFVKFMHRLPSGKRKKRWLIVSIALNLGLLAWFKYANFFVDNIQMIQESLNLGSMQWTAIALPIGISFYTFQTLTYSIDVYRGVHAPLNRVRDYVLYIIMFPQLIAGPIVRFHEIADQLVKRSFNADQVVQGFVRFSLGLAKKVLIANVLGAEVDEIMRQDLSSLSTSTAWLTIICYTFQIYFDFSGYSDMAIGLGRMFGFKFPENFNAPYISSSITEFWRRWHITLSNFMRDYLYIPLGGNRNSKFRTYRNLGLVFFLSGLWHGASWNFVLWGVWHGTFLILERLTGISKNGKYKWIRIPFTFLIVVLGWVLFRLETPDQYITYFQRLFAFEGLPPLSLYNAKLMTILILAFLLSFSAITRPGQKILNWVYDNQPSSSKHFAMGIASILLFMWSVSNLVAGQFNPFIYFRF